MAKRPSGFVPLSALARKPASPRAALADIRRIYFRTTRETIEHDLLHAIELLKTLPTEAEREKATVYMEGLAEMQKEWRRSRPPGRRR
jgi:hypothetical protein